MKRMICCLILLLIGELKKRIGHNSRSRRMGVLTHREEDPTN